MSVDGDPRRAREIEHCDVAVVGGGPAGLSAALHLARAGADVILLDEAEELGGQYFKRRQGAVLAQHGDFRPEGTSLIAAVRGSGVRCRTGCSVWGVGEDGRTLLVAGPEDEPRSVSARAVLVATGGYERSIPFRGWQLPGVVTPGYALHLATCDRIPVGKRAVVAGTGPFLLPVSCALLDVGVEVAAVVELNRPYKPSRRAAAALAHPARLAEFASYRAVLARRKVPLLQGWQVVEATGRGAVQRVRIESVGGHEASREYDIDALAVAYGFRPSTELVRLLGARCEVRQGDLVPRTDGRGRTTAEGVYVAGESAGIAGAHVARLRGEVAAASIAADLGLSGAARPARATLRRLRRGEGFGDVTAALYPVPDSLVNAVCDRTVICRCEGVTAGQIRAADAVGWNDRNSVKGATRAGMGPCQGRECAPAVAALCGASGSAEPFPARMPIKPVPIRVAMGLSAEEGS